MQVSLKWLGQFIDITDISPENLAHRITMSGLEVSGIHDQRQSLTNVVVGKITHIEPHPNADKLQLTQVDIPGQRLNIVCGAKNIAVNDVVPVATIGAVLPGDFQIKRSKIRGQESEGMLCSEKELGIADDAAGIMQLPSETELGTDVAQLLGLDDVILEIEITPNRSDCLSHHGIARHLAAVLDRPLKLPQINLKETDKTAASVYKVAIEDDCGCRRYSCRIIENVKIAPSPGWLKRRLENVGLRSVNNVVDATNLMLMEYGHPLHAFDMDRLNGHVIQARISKKGESIKTIDGEKRQLSGQELVIADESSPVALAGVMGGFECEVTDQTKNILLESAWFDPGQVRKTSKLTGCQSDSSYRFERGVDPEKGLMTALNHCTAVIQELAGGELLQGIIDNYPLPLELKTIVFRIQKAESLLGMELDREQTVSALKRLGYLLDEQNDGVYKVTVPPYRHDVSIEPDLIEDVAQLIGYDHIPTQTPLVPMTTPVIDKKQTFISACRQLVKESGYTEIITYSFMDPALFDQLRLPESDPWRQTIRLRNPLSESLSQMRPALLPGLLETMVYNSRRGQERINLFECGSVYIPTKPDRLPDEPVHLGFISTGPKQPMYWQRGKKQLEIDFYDLKGGLDTLFAKTGIKSVQYKEQELPFLHPLISYELQLPGGQSIGWLGALHPEIQEAYKLKHKVYMAELDLQLMLDRWQIKPKLKSHSRFPTMKRDIALAVSNDTLAGDVIRKIQTLGKNLLVDIIPFDQYKSDSLEAGTKSLAFSLTFQHHDRTLQDEEVNALQENIIKQLQNQFGAKQR